MEQLVSTQWLADELGAEDLVVLDCTIFLEMTENGFVSRSGRANWQAGHLAGAGYADLNEDLVDTASSNRYALPSPRAFADAMQRLGVGDQSRVVLYDESRSMWAARVWWMLRWIGFDNAALLDGGLQAWRAEGRELTIEAPDVVEGALTVQERTHVVADKAEVLAAVGDGSTCLVDALPAASYTGDINIYGRAGHIPGASNASAADLVDGAGRFLPAAELRARFPDDQTARVVNYCGGGIAASSTAFIQTLLGFSDVAVYTASLQEWASDEHAPMTTLA